MLKIIFKHLFILSISLSLKSEVFLLKPASFASFYFDESEKSFSLMKDSDHRKRIYKIDLNGNKKAKYYEKSDDNVEFELISEKANCIYDKTAIINNAIIRTISICFVDNEGGSPDSFHIEITDNYSKFTKSDGSIFGNHIECGFLIEDKKDEIFDINNTKNHEKNKIISYIYGAKNSSINKKDVELISKFNLKVVDWNKSASNCVIISKKFLEGATIGKSEIDVLKECESKFYSLSSEFESYFENSDDDGIKSFFRRYSVISYNIAIGYTKLIESVISGNRNEYQDSSNKLINLAKLKYNTFKPIVDRIENLNKSETESIINEFLNVWSITDKRYSNKKNDINDIELIIGNKKIIIDQNQWDILKSESEYSFNIERRKKSPKEKYNQIVNIFKIEMTKDRKIGSKISDNIYLEAFKTIENSLTIQIRMDKGNYWILSRQTFEVENNNIISVGEYANNSKLTLISKLFQDEISGAIYLINSNF